jgi:hypothetical protein
MASSSDKNLIIKNDKLYLIENGRSDFLASTEQSGSYNLFLEDSLFFFLSMNLGSIGRKKAKGIIANYLSTIFPEHMIKDFGFIINGGTALIYLPAPEFRQFVEENISLFKKASKITTPFVELFTKENTFEYSDGVRHYSVAGGEIQQLFDQPEDCYTSENSLYKIVPPKNSLNIEGVEKESFIPSKFKIPAIVLIICYLFFVGGEYFRVKGSSTALKQTEQKLQELYSLGGVAGSADPYGSLLYKARGTKSADQGISMLKVFEMLSKATDTTKINLDAITVRENNVHSSGTAPDFQTVEEYKQQLERVGARNIAIEDTNMQGNIVKFSVRFGI